MIVLITFSGLHGTGKTTIANLVAQELNLKHQSTGEIFRKMAEEKDVDIIEFSKIAALNSDIDKELDDRMKKLGLDGDIVLDGQLCWFFLNDVADWKIFLSCDEKTRINRIFNRKIEKGKQNVSFKDVKDETLKRERMEQERYQNIYGIDLSDEEMVLGNHNLVINTTNLTINEVVERILHTICNS